MLSAGVVTLGAPLVPQVQARFDVSEEAAQWSYTITLLVGATFTPVLGRLADGRRRRPAVLTACAMVSLGCMISAVAGGLAAFLVGRALQGIAVSLVAMTIACARDLVGGPRGVRLVALLSVTTAMGAGISYPLTTAVADHAGLEAAYAGAGVLSVVVSAAAMWGLPGQVAEDRTAAVDVRGAVLLVVSTSCGLLAISQGNHWGWDDPRVAAAASISLLLLLAWVRLELRTEAPLVNLRLMQHRNLVAAHLIGMLMGVSLYNTPVLVTRIGLAPPATGYGAGLSLTAIGLVMIPIAIGNVVGSRVATAASRRWGRRGPLAVGGVIGAAGPLLLLSGTSAPWQLVVAMLLSALGAGATFGTTPALIVDAVEPAETGSATSMNILLRAVGGAVGSAVTAALIGAHPGLPGYPAERGLELALIVCAAACGAAVLVSLSVPSRSRRTSPTPMG